MGRGFPGLKAQSLRPANQKHSFVFLGLRPFHPLEGKNKAALHKKEKKATMIGNLSQVKGSLTIKKFLALKKASFGAPNPSNFTPDLHSGPYRLNLYHTKFLKIIGS
jgi:hypothetical protein